MGFIRTRNGKHQAIYVDPTGRKRSAGTFSTKKAARDAIKDAEAALTVGQWIDPRDGRTTFRQYVETIWTPNRLVRPTTAATETGHLSKHLMPTFGHLPLAQITPTVIQGWVTRTLNAGLSPKSVRNIHGTLRAVLRRAVIDRCIDHNPAAVTELPMVPATSLMILTPEQVDLLWSKIAKGSLPLLMLLCETGMRWGESQALKVGDVDFLRRTILIAHSMGEVSKKTVDERFVVGPTKSNRVRRVKVSEDVIRVLAAHVAERKLGPDDLLVGATASRPWSRGNFHNRVWQPAREKADLPKVRLHDLRHTHASWLLAGGADLKVVMDRLGHSNLSTTQRYLHTMPDADDIALDALERVRQRAV